MSPQTKPRVRDGDYREEDRGFSTPCWIWLKSKDRGGYGYRWYRSKKEKAHRAYYEELRGEIPEGLVIDHLCRVRDCVNPDHMEPTTHAENTRRSKRNRLNYELAVEIRASDLSVAELARRHGVHETTIRAIRAGKFWTAPPLSLEPGEAPSEAFYSPWDR